MVDPYTPLLEEFSFTAAELAIIHLAIASDDPWNYKPATAANLALLKSAKDKILTFHLDRHGWNCCYCRTNLKGAGPFMTDREHILPKGKASYKGLSYTLWNLAAACKRCNMQFKRSSDEFVIDGDDPEALLKSENYRFVHPNFDRWEDHLSRFEFKVNSKNIVKIVSKGSEKAAYAHDFFSLKDFEVDSFDAGQCLDSHDKETAAVMAFLELAKQYDQ